MTKAAGKDASSRDVCVSLWNRVSQNIHAFELYSKCASQRRSNRLSNTASIAVCTYDSSPPDLQSSSLSPNMPLHVHAPAHCPLFLLPHPLLLLLTTSSCPVRTRWRGCCCRCRCCPTSRSNRRSTSRPPCHPSTHNIPADKTNKNHKRPTRHISQYPQ